MNLLRQKKWIIIISLFSYIYSFAADMADETNPNDPPGDGDGPNPAPIDNYIILLAFAAIALGFFLIRKHSRKTNHIA